MSNREIDALIHHECMGVARPPKGWLLDKPIPAYSTDPYASKQLRDKLAADGCGYTLEYHNGEFGDQVGFAMTLWLPGGVRVHADGDTEEMATHRAALKAVGVQQEEE